MKRAVLAIVLFVGFTITYMCCIRSNAIAIDSIIELEAPPKAMTVITVIDALKTLNPEKCASECRERNRMIILYVVSAGPEYPGVPGDLVISKYERYQIFGTTDYQRSEDLENLNRLAWLFAERFNREMLRNHEN